MRRLDPPAQKAARAWPLLLLVLALVAPACSAFGEAPAATVEGREISTDVLNLEVETIHGNDEYRDALESSFGRPVTGDGTFDAAFAAQILTLRVYYELIEDDLESRGVEVSSDAIDQATQEVEEQFGGLGPDVFSTFPKRYREQLIRQRAILLAVDEDVTKSIGDDEEEFFEENPEEFAEICLSHVLVAVGGERSASEARSQAQELYDRIEAGEEFEDIATDESDDTVAAAEGGSLGCGSRTSLQFDPVFTEAAFALEEDVVSEPVQTQFGSHLILVTSREIPDYEDVADQVPQVMSQLLQQRQTQYFMDVFCDRDVHVNPRYGTWTDDSCAEVPPQLPTIEPPEGPVGTTDTTALFGQ